MTFLQGGRENKIRLRGDVVERPAGSHTKPIHTLLTHIRAEGFHSAPIPLGFDEQGNERVSFLHGEVSNYPLSVEAKTLSALLSAATLLRNYHNATVSFLNAETLAYSWMLPARSPAEVICHGDYAPYNVVLDGDKAVGIIDFDTAHPAPRIWDIAYALYRWAPMTNPDNHDGFGSFAEQMERARLFCEAYGLARQQRALLPDMIVERMETMIAFMVDGAKAGNEAFQANLRDGHHLLYQADIDYLKQHRQRLTTALMK